jgi:hypothetical protein
LFHSTKYTYLDLGENVPTRPICGPTFASSQSDPTVSSCWTDCAAVPPE